MKNQQPWITEKKMEQHANALLLAHAQQTGRELTAPISIDEIAEKLLGLTLEIKDLSHLSTDGDVLGALHVDNREIWINASLDPSLSPHKEGRFRFTVAHEVGHWDLHRLWLTRFAGHPELGLSLAETPPSIICRSSSKDQLEYQADFFAGCMLMPTALIDPLWRENYGSSTFVSWSPEELAEERDRFPGRPDDDCISIIFERRAAPLASAFEVSKAAMRVRLEGLGRFDRTAQTSLF